MSEPKMSNSDKIGPSKLELSFPKPTGDINNALNDDRFRRLTRNDTRKRLPQHHGVNYPDWETIEQYAPQVSQEIIRTVVYKAKAKSEPNLKSARRPFYFLTTHLE